jgi:type IV secretory pathway VirJ component
VTALVLSASAAPAAPAPETFHFQGFGPLALYPPSGVPSQVVLFLSGDGGWNLGVVSMAESLRDAGALVVGIDIRSFTRRLERSGTCVYPAGQLEELSRAVQLKAGMPEYRRPILVGYSSGATLAYAALAAAPPETFAGAISLGFCPDIQTRSPLCALRGLAFGENPHGKGYLLSPFHGLSVPWTVLQGDADRVCAATTTRAFVAATGGAARLVSLPKVGHGFAATANWEPQYLDAYRAIAASAAREEPPASASAGTTGLSLVEVPAQGGGGGSLLAVILTGDGGWAEIDKGIAAGLASAGVPVVGWSSLRYYWTPRTPDGAAADLARIVEHYGSAWGKPRVLLVGYSFGADVLPFLVNRLPPSIRARVAGVALLGLSEGAAFQFHFSGWLGAAGGGSRLPTVPEVDRLRVPALCIAGTDEKDSACHSVRASSARVLEVAGGHHFGGDYAGLARMILRSVGT